MKLPILMPDVAEQRYDCHGCSNCCRSLVVHLTAADRQRIDAGKWAERLGTAPYVRLGGEWVLAHRDGGGCVFLTDSGRCAIHAEFGAEVKPLACRLYPFTTIRSHGRENIGLRFDCKSVAESRGSSLVRHSQSVAKLVALWEAEGPPQRAGQADLVRGTAMTDLEYATALKQVDGWLTSDGPAMARIRGVAMLAATLSEARLDRVRGERFDELLSILIADLPRRVNDEVVDEAPSRPQLRLLREWVFAHLEYATFDDMRAGFLTRLRGRFAQLARARAMANGRGRVPRLDRTEGDVTFEKVEEVAAGSPSDENAIAALLVRYLRVRVAGGAAWGPGHGGHPFAIGLQATLLSLAVTGWVARWHAALGGRSTCSVEDWAAALGRVDRTATRSPVLRGTAAGLRLRYLSGESGIERLLGRYLGMSDVRST